MSSSFLLVLVVLLAFASFTEASPFGGLLTLLGFAPAIVPAVSYLSGCYYSTRNLLQCPAGATIELYGQGFDETTQVHIGSSYTCDNGALNGTKLLLTCSLPSYIQSQDFGTSFPVTVTTGAQTSAPFGGVEFLQEPVLPGIDSIDGCVGGDGTTTASACRTGQRITIVGTNFYNSNPCTVSIGPYVNLPATFTGNYVGFILPAFAAEDLGVSFPVTVNIGGYFATYSPGLSSYGTLSLTSVTGCGSTSNPITGCAAGDVITLTGSGFNLGNPGDVNSLRLRLTSGNAVPFTPVSNTVIHLTLPSPPAGFSERVSLTAGTGMFPVTTAAYQVLYTSVLIVQRTVGTPFGCYRSPTALYPTCNVGDILGTWVAGGTASSIQTVTIHSPSGRSYNCGSLYLNGTSNTVSCTVPQVSAMDLGQVLSVSVSTGQVTSPLYAEGLLIPLA